MAQHVLNPPSAQDLRREIEGIVRDTDDWLRTPNDQLGGRQPIELMNGTEEQRLQVYNLVKAIEHGMVS